MSELKTRILARKKQLEADLLAAKADAQGAASEASAKIKARIDKLEHLISDGWDNLGEGVKARLNEWLRHDNKPSKGGPTT